jgi:predicted acetyltransferase
MNDPQILPATPAQAELLDNLMNLYLYDFSEFTGDDPSPDGRFHDDFLPLYWKEPGRFPFLIQVGGQPAGFVLVRDTRAPGEKQVTHHIAEFFIMRRFRRQKLGQRVAWDIFGRFPGRWRVEQIPENLPAQAFWRKTIAEYTHGNYSEIYNDANWDGVIQIFETPTQDPK